MHAKRRFIGQRFFNTIPGISASYNSLENLTLLSLLGLKKIEWSVEFLVLKNYQKIALKNWARSSCAKFENSTYFYFFFEILEPNSSMIFCSSKARTRLERLQIELEYSKIITRRKSVVLSATRITLE